MAHIHGAAEKIQKTVMAWEGISSAPHRFGGIEFRLGKKEIGHLHGDYLLDIPFPKKVRDDLVGSHKALPHHIYPESGWVSFTIKQEKDVEEAIALLKLSFDVTKQRSEQ